jgi:hypothetical protein
VCVMLASAGSPAVSDPTIARDDDYGSTLRYYHCKQIVVQSVQFFGNENISYIILFFRNFRGQKIPPFCAEKGTFDTGQKRYRCTL